MKPEDIKIGMWIGYGIDRPRRVEVVGLPFEREHRWVVPVRFVTGETVNVPLSLVCTMPKRPSARRKQASTSLRGIVKAFNEVAPEPIAESEIVEALRKHGVG